MGPGSSSINFRVLPFLGVAKKGAVPLIEDVVDVRGLLEMTVRDDLLNLAGGAHGETRDMNVGEHLCVGKLAPRRPDGDHVAVVEPASTTDDNGDLDEIDTRNNQSLVPFSMGRTFCVLLQTEC